MSVNTALQWTHNTCGGTDLTLSGALVIMAIIATIGLIAAGILWMVTR